VSCEVPEPRRFELEVLEPRILLNGLPVATPPVSSSIHPVVEEHVVVADPVATASLAHSTGQDFQLFSGVEGAPLDAAQPAEDATDSGEDSSKPASRTDEQSTKVQATASESEASTTDLHRAPQVLVAKTESDTGFSAASELTQTLRAANGPPTTVAAQRFASDSTPSSKRVGLHSPPSPPPVPSLTLRFPAIISRAAC
jgi:hypothetical protein